MIACVKEGTNGPDIYAMTIDTIRDVNLGPLKMDTRWHWKQSLTPCDNKRNHRTDYYHSLAYGHSEAKTLVSMKDVLARYRKYLNAHKKEIEEKEIQKEKCKKDLYEKFRNIFDK